MLATNSANMYMLMLMTNMWQFRMKRLGANIYTDMQNKMVVLYFEDHQWTDEDLNLDITMPEDLYEISNFPVEVYKINDFFAIPWQWRRFHCKHYGLGNIDSFLDRIFKPTSMSRNLKVKKISSGLYFVMRLYDSWSYRHDMDRTYVKRSAVYTNYRVIRKRYYFDWRKRNTLWQYWFEEFEGRTIGSWILQFKLLVL